MLIPFPKIISYLTSRVALRGFSLRGFGDVRGFPFCGGKKGSETPSCGGEKDLSLPCSLGRSMRNEGVSDTFPHRMRESHTLFPPQKGKPRTSPKPLSANPLSATHHNSSRISGVATGRLALGSRLLGTRPEFLDFPERKSTREGASSLFGLGPERPKIVSCSRATQTCTGATLGLP